MFKTDLKVLSGLKIILKVKLIIIKNLLMHHKIIV